MNEALEQPNQIAYMDATPGYYYEIGAIKACLPFLFERMGFNNLHNHISLFHKKTAALDRDIYLLRSLRAVILHYLPNFHHRFERSAHSYVVNIHGIHVLDSLMIHLIPDIAQVVVDTLPLRGLSLNLDGVSPSRPSSSLQRNNAEGSYALEVMTLAARYSTESGM